MGTTSWRTLSHGLETQREPLAFSYQDNSLNSKGNIPSASALPRKGSQAKVLPAHGRASRTQCQLAAGDSLSGRIATPCPCQTICPSNQLQNPSPAGLSSAKISKLPRAPNCQPVMTPVLGFPADAELYVSCSEMFIAQVPETTWRPLEL